MKTCSSEMHQFESVDPVKHKTQSSVNLYCAKSVELYLNWIKFIATNKSSTMGSLICGVPDTIRWLLLCKSCCGQYKFWRLNFWLGITNFLSAFDQGFCYDFWSLFWLQSTVFICKLNNKASNFGTFDSFRASHGQK